MLKAVMAVLLLDQIRGAELSCQQPPRLSRGQFAIGAASACMSEANIGPNRY